MRPPPRAPQVRLSEQCVRDQLERNPMELLLLELARNFTDRRAEAGRRSERIRTFDGVAEDAPKLLRLSGFGMLPKKNIHAPDTNLPEHAPEKRVDELLLLLS